jgi:hypothetical protein
MTEPTGTEKSPDSRSSPALSPDEDRRRLLKGSLGAAPLLLTLVSRPVLGGTRWTTVGGGGNGQCVTPSGFVSMPTSQHGTPSYCSGRTPGFWKQEQHFSSWVPPYYPTTVSGPGGHPATKFTDVFYAVASPYPSSTTFLEVLGLQGGPPNDVARHIVAAVLNVAAGWTPVLTIPVLQGIWSEYINTGGGTVGYFEPTAGVKWYHDDIVTYLLSTQTL